MLPEADRLGSQDEIRRCIADLAPEQAEALLLHHEWAELVSMWTAPTHRRGGVGSLLVASVIAWARSRQLRTLRLMVTNTNETAIRFYERLGFALTGRTEPYANSPALEELEMAVSIR